MYLINILAKVHGLKMYFKDSCNFLLIGGIYAFYGLLDPVVNNVAV